MTGKKKEKKKGKKEKNYWRSGRKLFTRVSTMLRGGMEKRKRTKNSYVKKNEQTYGYDNLLFHIHPYPSIFKHIRVLMSLMTLKNSIDLR